MVTLPSKKLYAKEMGLLPLTMNTMADREMNEENRKKENAPSLGGASKRTTYLNHSQTSGGSGSGRGTRGVWGKGGAKLQRRGRGKLQRRGRGKLQRRGRGKLLVHLSIGRYDDKRKVPPSARSVHS